MLPSPLLNVGPIRPAIIVVIRLARKARKPPDALNGDVVSAFRGDHTATGQTGHSARNGFYRQAEIISHVEAGHREFDLRRRLAPRPPRNVENKAANFLLGALAREQNHLFLSGRHLFAEMGEELWPQLRETRDLVLKAIAGTPADFD